MTYQATAIAALPKSTDKIDPTKYMHKMGLIFPEFMNIKHNQEEMIRWLSFLQKGTAINVTTAVKQVAAHFPHTVGENPRMMKSFSTGSRALMAKLYSQHCPSDPTDQLAHAYAQLLPHVAVVYAQMQDVKLLFAAITEKINRPRTYSLILLRPSIEHYMLWLVLGRGGTGELGATLWGQTELSCYDDAMHGKWGMNYKYHARAVVFNEKHLLRLWDVAFNGYTGGMGTNILTWTDKDQVDEWNAVNRRLDEPIRYDFKDICVLHFKSEDCIDKEVSNPVFFGKDSSKGATLDADNLYNIHTERMNVFEKFTDQKNIDRWTKYEAKMPGFEQMAGRRKAAGHAAHEGDTSVSCLSFAGTMQVVNSTTRTVLVDQQGTGHCGDSYAGVASIRAGNGSMSMGRPMPYRLT